MTPLEQRLTEENAELRAQVKALTAELAKVSERLDLLLQLVRETKGKKRKAAETKAKEKPAPAPVPELTEEQRLAFENRPRPGPRPAEEKKEPTVQTRPGRRPPPEHLEKVRAVSQPTSCLLCGSDDLGVHDSRLVEHLDAALDIVRNRVTRLRDCVCRDCDAMVPADRPSLPFERAKVTCEMLAYLMYTAFYLLVPLDRIRLGLKASGVSMSIGYLVKLKQRAAELLDAINDYHWQQLLARPWIQVDGTGHKVIIKDLPGTHHGYLEVFCGDDIVVFQFALNKWGQTLVDRLRTFAGTLVCDAESRNGMVFGTDRITEAGCNAHVYRALEAAEKEQPVLAAEGLGFLGRIYDIHRTTEGLGLEETGAVRSREIRPIYEELARWRDAVEPTLPPTDGLAKVLRYLRNQWTPLTRWLDDPALPPDNNACEREFQRIAKGRLAWLFFGGPTGGHRAATLLGIVATCQRVGVDVLRYFAWAFERLGTARERLGALVPEQLTPAAYKASLVAVAAV